MKDIPNNDNLLKEIPTVCIAKHILVKAKEFVTCGNRTKLNKQGPRPLSLYFKDKGKEYTLTIAEYMQVLLDSLSKLEIMVTDEEICEMLDLVFCTKKTKANISEYRSRYNSGKLATKDKPSMPLTGFSKEGYLLFHNEVLRTDTQIEEFFLDKNVPPSNIEEYLNRWNILRKGICADKIK